MLELGHVAAPRAHCSGITVLSWWKWASEAYVAACRNLRSSRDVAQAGLIAVGATAQRLQAPPCPPVWASFTYRFCTLSQFSDILELGLSLATGS